MSISKYLSLYLDAPLQSWGYQSRFDRRTSLSYPTRSGIVGMLCAAMGIDRADSQALSRFKELNMTVYLFHTNGRLMDFHTVGGGWDKNTHPQNVVPTAEGKPSNTVVTYREFLQGAKFGVVLKGNSSFLEKIAAALQNPRWGIWLGRKCCIPAAPVFQGIHGSEERALGRLRELAGTNTPQLVIREVKRFGDGTDTIMDIPVDFAERQIFLPRRVHVDIAGGN